MRKFFLLFAFLCSVASLYAQSQLDIKVWGMKDIKGEIYLAVCENESQFEDKSTPIVRKKIAVTSDTVKTSIYVPIGEYAITLYHDENGNEKLDKNVFGIPKERYGFSNNEYGPHGSKPKFKKAAFKTNNEEAALVDIELRR